MHWVLVKGLPMDIRRVDYSRLGLVSKHITTLQQSSFCCLLMSCRRPTAKPDPTEERSALEHFPSQHTLDPSSLLSGSRERPSFRLLCCISFPLLLGSWFLLRAKYAILSGKHRAGRFLSRIRAIEYEYLITQVNVSIVLNAPECYESSAKTGNIWRKRPLSTQKCEKRPDHAVNPPIIFLGKRPGAELASHLSVGDETVSEGGKEVLTKKKW